LKYYIIAGEASGDLHASNLVKSLKFKDPQAEFRGWGGDLMQNQSVVLVKHIRDTAFMGFTEVILNLRTILGNISLCKKDILEFKPDVVICVDFPGFNLRIAGWAAKNNIPVHYYISPQVWAWKEGRVRHIKKSVSKMYCILPFEKEFYAKHGMDVEYVGHPLLDAIGERTTAKRNENVIALLPGSRKQEIERMLPEMLKIVDHFKEYEFIIAGAPSQKTELYQQIIIQSNCDTSRVNVWHNKTYPLLETCHAAVVTSGTATMETALFGVPQVVCYKGGDLSYQIAKRLIKNIRYISLVNLVMDAPVVPELIQSKMNHQNIIAALDPLLHGNLRETMLQNYRQMHQKLGTIGASERVASVIYNTLSRQK
jgi:lipid-A-disaccharide synthase